MRITFNFNGSALKRIRNLELSVRKTGKYAIPNTPEYARLLQFCLDKGTRYPFILQDVVQSAGVMMLQRSVTRSKSFMAAGGLYLALDMLHSDLSISQAFGDFASGFSHQFGVAFAVMAMSEAYDIPWDRLVPIPVRGSRVVDYEAPIPGTDYWLRLEAKGATSQASHLSAIHSAYGKKLVDSTSTRRTFPETTAMVNVITRAARTVGEQGCIEIADPDLDVSTERRSDQNQLAGQYLHYGTVARFAGMYRLGEIFDARADTLIEKGGHPRRIKRLEFDHQAMLQLGDHLVAGVQWKVGEGNDSEDVWFYHGVDVERLKAIALEGEIPKCSPYFTNTNPDFSPDDRYSDGFLPDGSYFGVGVGRRDGLLSVDKRQTLAQDISVEFIE